MRRMNSSRLAAVTEGLYGILALAVMSSATAETTAQIDAGVKAARDQCGAQIPGCNEATEKAAGMLVFPEVTKAAVGVGGAYGEGALIVGDKTAGYYSTTSASVGLQLGAHETAQIIMFINGGSAR